jgi:hypothetical protein
MDRRLVHQLVRRWGRFPGDRCVAGLEVVENLLTATSPGRTPRSKSRRATGCAPTSCSAVSLLDLATDSGSRRPGRGRPARARLQRVGHDLHHRKAQCPAVCVRSVRPSMPGSVRAASPVAAVDTAPSGTVWVVDACRVATSQPGSHAGRCQWSAAQRGLPAAAPAVRLSTGPGRTGPQCPHGATVSIRTGVRCRLGQGSGVCCWPSCPPSAARPGASRAGSAPRGPAGQSEAVRGAARRPWPVGYRNGSSARWPLLGCHQRQRARVT